jgi:hypothetical protein
MPGQDQSSRVSKRQHGGRPYRNALAFVWLVLVFVSGCGSGASALLPLESVEILRGKDSAGATIELEKRGDDLTGARVIDVVLGTGEAEIISTTDRSVEFTIDFPAGATITYVGTLQPPSASSAQAVAGTWTQHAEGIFGEDTGTWEAAADPVQGADR